VIGLTGALVTALVAAGLLWKASAESTDEALQSIVDGLVQGGYPPALATHTDPDGSRHEVRASVADRAGRDAVTAGGEVRMQRLQHTSGLPEYADRIARR
jgi:hypothetical protein